MSKQREAMQMALTFIESLTGMHPEVTEERDEVSATLREALAQPQGEPVAWVVYDTEANDIVWSEEGKKLKAETPLYTTPPTADKVARQMRDAAVNAILDFGLENVTGGTELVKVADIVAALPLPGDNNV